MKKNKGFSSRRRRRSNFTSSVAGQGQKGGRRIARNRGSSVRYFGKKTTKSKCWGESEEKKKGFPRSADFQKKKKLKKKGTKKDPHLSETIAS